jgi:hypothetical protein
MSKDPHIANIFSAEEEDCLSLEQMTAYQESRLQGQEKHLVERHLLNCELCAMTFESLGEHGAESLAAGAEEVTERAWDKIQEGEKRKRRGAIFWIVSAASVVLLVTVGYFSMQGPSGKEMQDIAEGYMGEPRTIDTSSQGLLADSETPEGETTNATSEGPHETILQPVEGPSAKSGIPENGMGAKGSIKRMDNGLAAAKSGKDAIHGGAVAAPNNIAAEDGDFSNDQKLAQPTPKPLTNTYSVMTNDPNRLGGLQMESLGDGMTSRDKNSDDSKDYVSRSLGKEPAMTTKKEESKEFAEDDQEGYADTDLGGGEYSGGKLDEMAEEETVVMAEKRANADRVTVADERRNEVAKGRSTKAKTFNAGADQPKAATEGAVSITAPAAPRQDAYADGISAYEQGNYREAAAQLRKATEATPGNLNAHLFAADAYLRISQPQAALFHIERILATPGNSVYEDAEWYKALAYLQLKEAKKAQKQLETVIARNGKFKARAEAALNELK